MGKNRKRKAVNANDITSKRFKEEESGSSAFSHVHGPINPETGQQAAFPGLDDDEPFYGPAQNGLDYLRMVRTQAKTVPKLLTTIVPLPAKEEIEYDYRELQYDEGSGGGGLPYDEEDQDEKLEEEEEEEEEETSLKHISRKTPSQHYHARLISRFEALRSRLTSFHPPNNPVPISLPTYPPTDHTTRSTWLNVLLYTPPSLHQLCYIPHETALKVLQLLASNYIQRGREINEITGFWTWVLLAKLEDRGTMDGDKIAEIRELGKRAVRVGKVIIKDYGLGRTQDKNDQDVLVSNTKEEEMDGSDGATNGEDGTDLAEPVPDRRGSPGSKEAQEDCSESEAKAIKAARAALLERVNQEVDLDLIPSDEEGEIDEERPWPSTLMTLDLVITVVGEVYGQRDLLEGWETWPDAR